MDVKKQAVKNLRQIPGVGVSIANDLWNLGITSVDDLKGKKAEVLYDLSNQYAGVVQDRCLLYVYRCAVYYANTEKRRHNPEKLKWWNWKDSKKKVSVKSKLLIRN